MTTQLPEEISFDDLNQGMVLPTIVASSDCEPCNLNLRYNEFALFTLPHRLDRAAANRGIDASTSDPAFDVQLGEAPIVLYVYFSAHAAPMQNSSSPAGSVTNVGAMPAVRFDARWETGRHPGRGEVLAEGSSSLVNFIHGPGLGGDPSHEVRIDLQRHVDTVPAGVGTLVSIKMYQVNEGGAEFLQSDWRLRSGESYPWRVIVSVKNPLEAGRPQIWSLNETLNVEWGVRGAFGSYDVDDRSFHLTARNDAGVERTFPPFQVERNPNHNGQLSPVVGVWRIPFDALPESEAWTLSLSASNLQGTYKVEGGGTAYLVRFQGANEVPGFDAVFLLASIGLAGAVVGVRNRRRG